MNFNSFKKMVQTFGSCRDRWETDDIDSAAAWTESAEGAGVIRAERLLDAKLDLFCPPVCSHLADRLYATIVNEKTQRQIFLLLRYSTWLSLLFIISGFCLGWYQTHQDYVNTQSYFDTMFDISY